ncbi:MAG TPA: FecR family protein [Burkholderiales bacterium]|nr:FecR family protein [Burkholderiales bacterium]
MVRGLFRTVTILLIIAAGPAAAADIGRVLLATGEAVVVRDKQLFRLVHNSAIRDRDVLRTGPASTLQVRFIDESMLSMRENSEMRIDEFRFSGKEDGSERGFFSLLKGGLRQVTGLVGRTNHKNYRMDSIVGTIGIRGTDFATTLCQQDCRNPDGTLARDGQYTRVIGASHGTNRVTYSNQMPEREFGIGESFFAADSSTEPQRLLVPPSFVGVAVGGVSKPPAGTGIEQPAAGGAQQDPRGRSRPGPRDVLPLTLTGTKPATDGFLDPVTSVTGTAKMQTPQVSAAFGFIQAYDYKGSGLDIGFYVSPSMLSLSGGRSGATLTAYNIPAGTTLTYQSPNSFPVAETGVLTGTVVDTGSVPSINTHWGRWTSGNFTDLNGAFTLGPGGTGMHYMLGDLAPPDVVASKTGTFSFNPIGGTTPTNNLGETASSFNYPTLSINFTSRAASLGGFNWIFPSNNWSFSPGSANVVIKAQGAGIQGSYTGGGCTGTGCGVSVPTAITLGVSGTFFGMKGNDVGMAFGATAGSATAAGVQLYSCSPSC